MDFTWLQENALVILFYLMVALIIYFNRKKFEFQGIIALYKTKLGIKAMKKFATPLKKNKDEIGKKLFSISLIIFLISTFILIIGVLFNVLVQKIPLLFLINNLLLVVSFITLCISVVYFRQIKKAGVLGIYVGFLGMVFMAGLIIVGFYMLLFVPSAPPLFAPVLPGISIPGVPFTLPLFEGLIALIVVIIIHEFSHGVVSKAYKIPIKSSGFVMLGPIPGAFVEPDEKKLKKASIKSQLSIYAAGPFSNILLAILLLMMILIITPVLYEYDPSTVKISGHVDTGDLQERGILELERGELIQGINNKSLENISSGLMEEQNMSSLPSGREVLIYIIRKNYEPGDSVVFITNKGERQIILGHDSENESLPFIGVYLDNAVKGKNVVSKNEVFTSAYFWLMGNPFSSDLNKQLGLIYLIFVLSFGIGIVNLLPVGALDGGRMTYLVLRKRFSDKKANKIIYYTSKIIIFLLLILIFVPMFKAIFNI